MRKHVVVATGLGLSLLLCGTAPPVPRDPQVAQGIRQLEEGDLNAALESLVGAARRLSSDPAARADLALVHLYSGLAYSGLDQEKAARASFREALALRPELSLDADRFPRRALRLFEQVRSEQAAASPPAVGPAQAAPSPWAGALRGVLRVRSGTGAGCCGVALGSHEVLTGLACVASGAPELELADGRRVSARAAGQDADSALALLRVEGEPLPALELGPGEVLEVGAPVTALARGLTGARAVSGRVTGVAPGPEGVVYQTDLVLTLDEAFGALLDGQGRLAGLTIVAEGPPGAKPLGFAYSAGVLRRVYEGLRTDGRVARGWLGITVEDVSDELARKHDLGSARGALVADVDPFGPAFMAGFRKQDILLVVGGGRVLTDRLAVIGAVAALKPGTEQSFMVYRPSSKKYVALRATVGQRPAPAAPGP